MKIREMMHGVIRETNNLCALAGLPPITKQDTCPHLHPRYWWDGTVDGVPTYQCVCDRCGYVWIATKEPV